MPRGDREGALKRATNFFKEVSGRTLPSSEIRELQRNMNVRQGLERFSLSRGWAKRWNAKQDGRTIKVYKFVDLSRVSPIHVREVMNEMNDYNSELARKRKEKKAEVGQTQLVVECDFENVTTATCCDDAECQCSEEFVWTDKATKVFALIYSGNFKSLPSKFSRSNYVGLKMDEKVERFKRDYSSPETKTVTITRVEKFTRTQSVSIEVPGHVEDVQEFLNENESLYGSDLKDMPTLDGTPFTDTTGLMQISSEYTYDFEDGTGGGEI